MSTRERRRRIVIVGAGQTGRALVRNLSDAWAISVLDVDPLKLERLQGEIRDRPVGLFQKDGTSLINLREAGIEDAVWLAALTHRDEVNIEACRLALSLERPPRAIGIVRQPDAVKRMQAAGAEALTRPAAIAGLLANRIQNAQQVAVNVGLGRGEILEIPVLSGSPAANTRIRDLRASRWLVAAIYRSDEFLIPHADAFIREGDRLLLTGDPEILPQIGDYLRAGVARFPLQFGSRVVALAEGRLSDRYRSEIEYLCSNTRAKSVRVLAPKSAPRPVLSIEPSAQRVGGAAFVPAWETEGLRRASTEQEISVRVESETFDEDSDRYALLLRNMPDLDCGLLVIEKKPAPLLQRIGLFSPSYRELLDRISCPLLLARGTHPYKRVILPVTDVRGSVLAADLAIDVSRELDAPLVAVTIAKSYFQGNDGVGEPERTRARISDMMSLYHLRMESIHIEGNPVRELARLAGASDLVVAAHRVGGRPSFFNPDATLPIVDRVGSSVLVLPFR